MSMPSGTPERRRDSEPGADGEVGAESAVEDHQRERRAQAQQLRPRMNIQQIHTWVDLEIEQAQRRGEFDNLPGAGKPIKNLEKNDPDWWVKGLIEREKLDLSSALPTVMALRQERRGFPESLAGISDEVAVRERLQDYNQRVLEDRRKPVVGPNPPAVAGRVDVDDMVAQWRQLRVDRERRLAAPGPPAPPTPTPEGGDEALSRRRSGWLVGVVALLVLALIVWSMF